MSKFEIPENIDHHLAILSKIYAREGQKQKQQIIVNANIRIHEESSYDNWNGGTYGHALYLVIPERLYLQVVRNRSQLENEIKTDINNLNNVQSEYIEKVFIEAEVSLGKDWRKDSGLILSDKRFIQPEAEKRIWDDRGFRLFLSHKAEVKEQASDLKDRLKVFGVSAFVAHQDIHPTKEWLEEIEYALVTMEALAALMTKGFSDSDWTDQEVGFAYGRGVQIIPVKLGLDPYGFIGKFQALSCLWDSAASEIVKLLIRQERMLEAFIDALQDCASFGEGNELSKIFNHITALNGQQAEKIVSAYNENAQLSGSYGFNGSWHVVHGPGIAVHLSRITGHSYKINKSGVLKPK